MPVARDPDFERALAERPDDAGLRLIYADWLDDHGEAAYAAAHRWLAANGRWPAAYGLSRLFGGPMNGSFRPEFYHPCKLPGGLHRRLMETIWDSSPGMTRSAFSCPNFDDAALYRQLKTAYTLVNWCVFHSHQQAVEHLARALEPQEAPGGPAQVDPHGQGTAPPPLPDHAPV